jgi:hypothetical protein
MTDRELLELAAKAADIELDWDIPPNSRNPWRMSGEGDEKGPASEWNPLTDDGDALRLAVNLGINLNFFERVVFAGHGGTMIPSAEEPILANADEATRRAIVRAAAEIGKEMK